MEGEVIPVLYVEDAARAVDWYGRLGFHKQWAASEFGIAVDEAGLAGRECDLEDPDGSRLQIATPRS